MREREGERERERGTTHPHRSQLHFGVKSAELRQQKRMGNHGPNQRQRPNVREKKNSAGTGDSVPGDTNVKPPTDTPGESAEGGEGAADPAAEGSVPDKSDKLDADQKVKVLAELWEQKDW